MIDSATYKAQRLLYAWLSNFEKRSYTQIKEACNYLNMSLTLNLGERPVVHLLYPLLYTGAIDHIGRDYYALTKPVALDFGSHVYSINGAKSLEPSSGLPIGWSFAERDTLPQEIDLLKMSSLSVLKSFPRIDLVIETWDSSLQDTDELSYHDYVHHIGVAEYRSEGRTKFFSIPDRNVLKEIPSREKNPEAYRIAICYERVLTGQVNGLYSKKNRSLRVKSFAFPFVLYRALMIDGLAVQEFPHTYGEWFVFENISLAVAKELNRILCKSIRYE